MSKAYVLYRFFFLTLFVLSMYPWFSWGLNYAWISLGILLFVLLLFMSRIKIWEFRHKYVAVSLFFLMLFLWMGKYSNVYGVIEQLANWGLLVSVVFLRDKYKADILRFVTKWFSILIIISFAFYLINLVGIPLPHTVIFREGGYNTYINYYSFLQIEGHTRFQGPFLEPGHLTLGIAPLLFLNKYDFRNKYCLFLFIAQLFTFSLAGYIVLTIGYVYVTLLSSVKHKLFRAIVPIFVFLGVMFLANSVFKENMFNDLILSRLEWNGTSISGDNRSSSYLDFVYDQVINSDQKWVGRQWQGEFSDKGVAGFKLYLVEYGLIGIFLVVLCYLSSKMLLTKHNRLEWGTLIIFLLLLFQDAYPTWWCLMLPLVCGNSFLLMGNND